MMKSNDTASKPVDASKTTPSGPDAGDVAASPAPPVKPARFDVAAANQAHLKSMSALRGRNAGPANKGPSRR